jgi:Membrane protease subunits, stomatin/prohibitin homologs
MKDFSKSKKVISIILVILAVIILGSMSVKTVGTGEIAVITRFGNVKDVKSSGLHFKVPVITKYNVIKISQQKIDGQYSTSTKDMQTISQNITVQYVVDISKVKDLYSKFLGNHERNIIAPSIAEVVQSVTSGYTIEEFVSKRMEISEFMEEKAKAKLDSYGITIVSIDITDHDFSDAYEMAVEAKKIAEQNVEKAEFEKKQAVIEAETNKIKSNAIDTNIKYIEFLKKWDGKLPEYVGEGGLDLVIPR